MSSNKCISYDQADYKGWPPCLRLGFRNFQTYRMIDVPILGEIHLQSASLECMHFVCKNQFLIALVSLLLRHYRVWFEIQLAKYAWQIASYNFVLFNNLNEVCIIQNKANLQWQIQLSMCLKITPFLPQNRGVWGFLSHPSVEAKTSSWKGPAQVVAVSSPCRGVEGLQGLGWYQLVPNWLTALGRGALQRANLHVPTNELHCSLSSTHCTCTQNNTKAHEHTSTQAHKHTSTHITLHKCNQKGALQRANLHCTYPSVLCSLSSTQAQEHTSTHFTLHTRGALQRVNPPPILCTAVWVPQLVPQAHTWHM